MNNLKETLLNKIFSGRWICTLVIVATYSYLAIESKIPIDKVSEITMLILVFYFTKERAEKIEKEK